MKKPEKQFPPEGFPPDIAGEFDLYELMIRQSSDVMWIMNLNLDTIYMSPSVEIQLGYTVEEYSKLPLSQRLPPESVQLIQKIMQTEFLPVIRGEREYDGKPIIYEMIHRHKNGELVWGEISFSFIRDSKGKIIAILGITRNISARKKAQKELIRSNEYFELLVENSNDWIWEVDKNYIYTYSNPVVEKLLGYSPKELIGKTPFYFSGAGTTDGARFLVDQYKKSGTPFKNIKITLRDANQRPVYLEVNGMPYFDEFGSFMGFRGLSRDASGHETEIKKLHQLETRHAGLLRQTDFGAIELDDHFEVLEWNAGATHIFGYTRGEAMVNRIFSSLWKDASWKTFLKKLKLNSQPVSRPFTITESQNLRQDDEVIQCRWHINPVTEAGKLKSIVIFVINITENKEASATIESHQMFFNSLCKATVFSDQRLKINNFPSYAADYLSLKSVLKKGAFVRNIFDIDSAKLVLDQGVKMAARIGYWKEQVVLNSENNTQPVTLEIIPLINSRGTLKGYAYMFDRIIHP